MAEITDVANAIFKFKNNWVYNPKGDVITNDDKEKFFFIFNRYFSKIYPDKAQLLNLKNIDKVMAMDIWFHFMKSEPYPQNFWSKTPKVEKEIPEKVPAPADKVPSAGGRSLKNQRKKNKKTKRKYYVYGK